MNKVVDFNTVRAKRQGPERPPTRDPDIELCAWLKDGEVNWVRFDKADTWPEDWGHAKEVGALLDASWTWAQRDDNEIARGDRPAFWYFVDNDGYHTMLLDTGIVTGTNWRHALWLLRQWWRISLKCWKYAWRAARGRG